MPHPRGARRGGGGGRELTLGPARPAALLGALLGLGLVGLRPRRVEVTGASMVPALLPGDRVLALRGGRYRRGDLVVVPDPRDARRLLVKRLAALPGESVRTDGRTLRAGPGEVVVLGDAPAASTDSRTLGPLRRGAVLGRCVYRYQPARRAGRLRRGADLPRRRVGPLAR